MIKFIVWIFFRENLSFDLGKKFGRDQADSLISRPNYGLNIQEPFSDKLLLHKNIFGYEKGQNSLSSYGSPSRERFLNGPNINAPKLKAEEIFSISTRVSGALRVSGNATVEAVPSDKRLGTYRFESKEFWGKISLFRITLSVGIRGYGNFTATLVRRDSDRPVG